MDTAGRFAAAQPVGEDVGPSRAAVQLLFTQLPEPFLLQLISRLPQDDVKSLRVTCSRLCALVAAAPRLTSLRAAPLLSCNASAPPSLARLPAASFLDFNARNADCGHRLLSALRALHAGAMEASLRAVRLSGRDGLLSALQALRLACPQLERLEIRCQHSYRGRHKECADLGRCLAELEAGFLGLQELHLTRFPISSAQLVHLCDSPGLRGLRSLSVRGLASALDSDSLAHLHRLDQLTSLSVDHLRLQGSCFPCGAQLRSLELSDATISARSFATLNSLTCLTSLSLWGTGARSALGFAPLPGLTSLRRLHLELQLDAAVLAGLTGCTALASLSAQGARVLAPHPAAHDGAAAAACGGGGGGGGPLPPQLTSVTRLSLESLDEECLPLMAWLPGLRLLALEEGEGVWQAVAGHAGLTSLRVAAGGSLPPPEPGPHGAMVCVASGAEIDASARAGPPMDGEEAAGRDGEAGTSHCCARSSGHRHHGMPCGSLGRRHGFGSGSGSSSGGAGASSSGGGGSSSSDGGEGDNACTYNGGTGGQTSDSACSAGLPAAPCAEYNGGCDAGHSSHWSPPPPQLASLRLGGCEGWPEQQYARCAPLPALTSCHLSGCACLTSQVLGQMLGCMPGLQDLTLEGAPHVTDAALVRLGGQTSSDSGTQERGEGGEGAGENGAEGGVLVTAVACTPAVAAAAAARGASAAAGVPVPPCCACAEAAEAAVVAEVPLGPCAGEAGCDATATAEAGIASAFPRSSSAAALAAAAAMTDRRGGSGGDPLANGDSGTGASADAAPCGAVPGLQRLELIRLPLITARGVAAAAAGLPRLAELRVSSCQAVCREACVWLPQQLGRPSLSVVCSHAAVYDDH